MSKLKVKDLTTEQKIKLIMGADYWSNYTVDGKLYKFVVSDGPVGLRQPRDRMTTDQWDCIKSVAYPSFQMLTHTWDMSLAYEMGYCLGNDCIEQDVDILLAPGVNIKRTPLNGRNFEYLSEDPLVAGVFAREYILGVQAKHVGTSLKHFCCNNAEYSRNWASMEVDERTMREIYLRPFEIACQAKPWTVMCAYNLVNGVRMSENTKLYGVLRNEFGFDGMIMSDWEAVKDGERSMNAGCNWAMPYNQGTQEKLLANADKLDMEKLDANVERVLELIDKCEGSSKLRKIDKTIEERRALSQKIEEEGIVLLKNDGALPLKDENIIVTGAAARRYYFGGGSSQVHTEITPDMLDVALKKEGANAEYILSVNYTRGHQAEVDNIKRAVRAAAYADCTVLCVGDCNDTEFEGADRQQIKLTNEEELAIHALADASEKLIVVVYAGSAIDMSNWIDDADAVVWAGYGGEFVNNALAKVLLGKVNPSGKLTETFPLQLEDVPSVNAYMDECCMLYSEGLNVGYRYFDTFGVPVLFPFGFGLSYSEFEYDNLTVEEDGEGFQVSFDITNISGVDGKEVAQVYVREITREVYRPYKELKGFAKVLVKAGQTERVSIALDRMTFAYWSTGLDCWHVNPGMFEICVGADCDDIRLSKKVEVK